MCSPRFPLELLSPARDKTVAKAAVDAGADAIYIGGPAFGARANASNAWSEIRSVVNYARQYRVKTYLTLNTVLFESELEEARNAALRAYECGVDALIIQDPAFLEMDLPPLELHASTQCDVRTPEKVKFLDDVGFSQIVLARELTLEEIALCRKAAQRARLEFFIHGALCVSYSGQCYLSAATRNRSANRGQCAQLCRLPYSVSDYKGDLVQSNVFALSLKDNDQSCNLKALIKAGVTSFKIEGRLKDASYVKNITAYYRKKLDALIEENGWEAESIGRCSFSFTPDPQKTFCRGKTDVFVNGRPKSEAELRTPKSLGEPVGRISTFGKNFESFMLDPFPEKTLHNGDGIAYFDKDAFQGLRVNRVENAGSAIRIYPFEGLDKCSSIQSGNIVYRNSDRLFLKELEREGSAVRKIPMAAELEVHAKLLTLKVTAGGQSVSCSATVSLDPAKNPERTQASAVKALSKTGDTVFSLDKFSLTGSKELFIPVSVLNDLRRTACQKLAEAIQNRTTKPMLLKRLPASAAGFAKDYRANVCNSLAKNFWDRHGLSVVESGLELMPKENLAGRELMRCRYCLRHEIGLCPKQLKGDPDKKEAFKEHNAGHLKPEPLTLADPKGFRYVAQFDCKHCEMTIELISELAPV